MTLTIENLETLRRPFAASDHEWRENKFCYITEEGITTRLEEVDPSWTLDIVNCVTRDNQTIVVVRLTVGGVARDGVGMAVTNIGEAEKSAATDALKRAARLFGVGRYLLDAPQDRSKFGTWLQSLTSPNAKLAAGQPNAPSASSASGDNGASDRPAQAKGGKPKWDSTQVYTFVKTLPRYKGNNLQQFNAVKASITDDMDTAQAIAAVKAYHDRKPAPENDVDFTN